VPRVVLPGLDKIKRSKALKDLPYIVLIMIILVSFSIGVAYFHGVDVSRINDLSDKYNSSWFQENNRSRPPPDISQYVTPPEENITNPPPPPTSPNVPEDVISRLNLSYINFIIEGSVPLLAWRLAVFDYYETDEGWLQGSESYSSYYGESRGSISFKILKPVEIAPGAQDISLVGLWQVSNGIEANLFEPINLNVSNIVFIPMLSDINQQLEVHVSSDKAVRFIIQYEVYGEYIDNAVVVSSSATLLDLQNYISSHPELNRFTYIPPEYFDTYPFVYDVISSINIDENATIYDTVSLLSYYFSINFNVSYEKTNYTGDPVVAFILNGGGSFMQYVYTLALALRVKNIPSRVILGYLGGYYNSSEDLTYLRVSDLFMWIEVFDPGLDGWVPYNCLTVPVDIGNLVETGLRASIYIEAPRYIEGIPCVYLDETFTITLVLTGPGAQYLEGEVVFIDFNESDMLGVSNLVPYGPGGAAASVTTSFEDFYSVLEREPKYGVHIIVISFKQLTFYVAIALLKRVSIQP